MPRFISRNLGSLVSLAILAQSSLLVACGTSSDSPAALRDGLMTDGTTDGTTTSFAPEIGFTHLGASTTSGGGVSLSGPSESSKGDDGQDDAVFIVPPLLDLGGGGETDSGGDSDTGAETEDTGGVVVPPPDACVPLTPLDERRSLIETNLEALAEVGLARTLDRIAVNAGLPSTPDTTHDLLIDHANDMASTHFPLIATGHCDDELTDGVPSLNGFPVECPRIEGEQVGNLREWVPIAAVNRLDLAAADGSHCGEQRLIFASNEQARMFIIFEAQIPNPDLACGAAACRPIAEFWAEQSEIDDAEERGHRLELAFFGGEPGLIAAGFPPFMSAGHMTFGTGQVRTNNFDQFPWTLKEFKLVEGPSGRLVPDQVPVSANPFGPLLDDGNPHPLGPTCRAAFIDAIDGLVTDDVNLMALDMPPECLAGESHDDIEDLYDLQISQGSQAFRNAIENRAADLGANLSAQQIGARAAFAGSCIGCHQQQVGANLGQGVTAPFSSGFVHVDEQFTESCGPSGGQCFAISPALEDVFLPFRHQVLLDVLAGCPDACETGAPAAATMMMPSLSWGRAALEELEATAAGSGGGLTIGGRPLAAAH